MINYKPSRKEQAIIDVIQEHFPSLHPIVKILSGIPVVALVQDGEVFLIVYNEFIEVSNNNSEE